MLATSQNTALNVAKFPFSRGYMNTFISYSLTNIIWDLGQLVKNSIAVYILFGFLLLKVKSITCSFMSFANLGTGNLVFFSEMLGDWAFVYKMNYNYFKLSFLLT